MFNSTPLEIFIAILVFCKAVISTALNKYKRSEPYVLIVFSLLSAIVLLKQNSTNLCKGFSE
jgi:hypothetical protein